MGFEVFEKVDWETYSVFKDKRVLSLSYIPNTIVCRDELEKTFARILVGGVGEGFLPPMIRVYGKTGSGKTVLLRSVLERFSKYKGDVFRFFYVNLKNCRTVFSAANAVLSEICGQRVPANLGLDKVFSKMWTEVAGLGERGELFLCFALDEVDSIFMDKHFDPSDFFYRFLRASSTFPELANVRMCLIAITNNPMVLEDGLDARVRSSMGSETIVFPSYSRDEIRMILECRVGQAFKEGVLEEGVLDYCAGIVAETGSDARKAVDLLRVSGEIANENRSKVTRKSVQAALERVEKDWIHDILRSIPNQSAVVVYLLAFTSVRRQGNKITTKNFLETYRIAKLDKGMKRLGERRVLDIINELETVGLISTWNVSRGRKGYIKEIVFNRDPQTILDFYESATSRLRLKALTAKSRSFLGS